MSAVYKASTNKFLQNLITGIISKEFRSAAITTHPPPKSDKFYILNVLNIMSVNI